MKPLAIDLCCGIGGWSEGLLAEGWDAVGFDVERHEYGAHKYQAQLVLQDVLTLHGRQFKDAALIVASPPCQKFSYMAMPWSRSKQMISDYESGVLDRKELTALFDACFRIQREACEAACRHIPLIVENVRGAQKSVGRARWNFGSFFLWGDVPALMPIAAKRKVPGFRFDGSGKSSQTAGNNPDGRKGVPHRTKGHWTNPAEREGVKVGGAWFGSGNYCSLMRRASSGSTSRKFASAMIAKIPFVLSQYIASVYKPRAFSA